MHSTRRTITLVTALAAAVWTGWPAQADDPGGRLSLVSHGDPAAACTAGASPRGVLHPGAEVEPFVATNPRDPHQAIGVWQQDRWSDGGSHAGGMTYTRDGRHYTEGLLPFGDCAGAGATDYSRISDLWVSWGPDGAAYASALEFDADGFRNGVGAATTFDGGEHWRFVQPVIADDDPAVGDDKNSVTADPDRAGTAYQVWDRLVSPTDAAGNPTAFDGPAMLSVTHDHGRTWSPPRVLVDTSAVPFSQTIGNIVVPDARTGALYDFFTFITYDDAAGDQVLDSHFGFEKSTDGGLTWSAPARIAADTSVNEVDPNAPGDRSKGLRAGGGLPNVAIDPATGELYLAYEGSDFSNGAYDEVQLVHSTDGGATWSAPALVSRPGVPAFTPAVTVDRGGTVHVVYYDLRHLAPGNVSTLPTSTWLLSFPRGRADAATERQIAPDFDWLQAPFAGGHMLGDYIGIAAAGRTGARPIVVTGVRAPADPTDVFSGEFSGEFPGGEGDGAAQWGPAQAAALTTAGTAGPRVAVAGSHPVRRTRR